MVKFANLKCLLSKSNKGKPSPLQQQWRPTLIDCTIELQQFKESRVADYALTDFPFKANRMNMSWLLKLSVRHKRANAKAPSGNIFKSVRIFYALFVCSACRDCLFGAYGRVCYIASRICVKAYTRH